MDKKKRKEDNIKLVRISSKLKTRNYKDEYIGNKDEIISKKKKIWIIFMMNLLIKSKRI